MKATKKQMKIIQQSNLSIFHNYFFLQEWYLSNIIKLINWGSNRVIRQQGFRVLPITQELKHIKQWDRITDPKFIIDESMYISKPKGQSVVVVHIGE